MVAILARHATKPSRHVAAPECRRVLTRQGAVTMGQCPYRAALRLDTTGILVSSATRIWRRAHGSSALPRQRSKSRKRQYSKRWEALKMKGVVLRGGDGMVSDCAAGTVLIACSLSQPRIAGWRGPAPIVRRPRRTAQRDHRKSAPMPQAVPDIPDRTFKVRYKHLRRITCISNSLQN